MSDYDSWWHDGNLALDVSRVERFESRGRVLEVMDHERFGRVVAVDGRLMYVEEDAAWRESLVHVALGGVSGDRPLRVFIVGGDPSIAAEVLRRDDVESVELDVPDPDFQIGWAHSVGLGADSRLRATSGASHDVVFVPASAAIPHQRLAANGVAIVGDAVVLEKPGARWLHARVRHDTRARWFAMSPLAPGGFYGFTAHATHDVDLSQPRRPFTGRHYNAELHRAAFALPAFFEALP